MAIYIFQKKWILIKTKGSCIRNRKENIKPPPGIGNKYQSEFICGMAKPNEEFMMLLDMDKVFSANELIDLKENTTKNESIAEAFKWNENKAGFSVYSSYDISDKFQIFGRFDQLESNTLLGESEQWNIAKDGQAIIAGVQYKMDKKVKLAANVQQLTNSYICILI